MRGVLLDQGVHLPVRLIVDDLVASEFAGTRLGSAAPRLSVCGSSLHRPHPSAHITTKAPRAAVKCRPLRAPRQISGQLSFVEDEVATTTLLGPGLASMPLPMLYVRLMHSTLNCIRFGRRLLRPRLLCRTVSLRWMRRWQLLAGFLTLLPWCDKSHRRVCANGRSALSAQGSLRF